MATDGKRAVWNCYDSTKESAKEMALFQLRKAQKEEATRNLKQRLLVNM